MTKKEFILKYKEMICMSKNKNATTKEILSQIDKLTYENNQLIKDEDKKIILEGLQQELFNESVLVHSQDNSEYLELISQAIKMLGGK